MAPSQLLQKLKEQAPDFEPRVMRFKNIGDKAASVRVAGSERGYVGDYHLGGVMLSRDRRIAQRPHTSIASGSGAARLRDVLRPARRAV